MTTAHFNGKTGSDDESIGCQHCHSTGMQTKATSLSSTTIRPQSFPTTTCTHTHRPRQNCFYKENEED